MEIGRERDAWLRGRRGRRWAGRPVHSVARARQLGGAPGHKATAVPDHQDWTTISSSPMRSKPGRCFESGRRRLPRCRPIIPGIVQKTPGAAGLLRTYLAVRRLRPLERPLRRRGNRHERGGGSRRGRGQAALSTWPTRRSMSRSRRSRRRSSLSDELLEDAVSVQSYINGRLSLFVRSRKSVSCFAGPAPTNSWVSSTARFRSTRGGTVVDNPWQLLKAMAGTRGSGPTWIPTRSSCIRQIGSHAAR